MRSMPFQFAFYVWILFICEGVGCIYTMPCTLVTLDIQRARAFHRRALQKLYCTVPFSSCVKPRPWFAYREMYPSVLSLSLSALLEDNLFWELIAFASLFLSSSVLKEGIHFTSSATGLWFVKISFFSSVGMVLLLSSHLTFDLS